MSELNKDSIINIFSINDGSLKKFNINDFNIMNNNATLKDIIYCAFVNKRNYFIPTQYFSNIQFTTTINGINIYDFNFIQFIPEIKDDVQNIKFVENITYINDYSIIQNTVINNAIVKNNLNAQNLQSFNILTNNIKSNSINSNKIESQHIIINKQLFNDTIGYIYINNFSLPLDINNYLFTDFNLIINSKVFITIKPNVKIICYDVNDNILFYLFNDTSKYIYMRDVFYNSNFYKINIKY